MERSLNVNFAEAIAKFESASRHFMIKRELYTRVFRGKGLEFDGYRDFAPGDDAELIDWKATMRAGGRLLCKQYIQERDLKILFLVDVGDNMVFGSGKKLKCEITAEVVVGLSHVFMNVGDRVGILLFSDKVNKLIPPSAGRTQFEAITSNIANAGFYGGKSMIEEAILFSLRYFPKAPDVIFLVSDFIRIERKSKRLISTLASLSDTIALIVRDPTDETMPKMSEEITIEDPYTHKQVVIIPKKIKKPYERYAHEQMRLIENIFWGSGVDYFKLKTDKPFIQYLISFLVQRLLRKRYVKIV